MIGIHKNRGEAGFFTYTALMVGLLLITLGLAVQRELQEALYSMYDEMYLVQCKYGVERAIVIAFKELEEKRVDLEDRKTFERRFQVEDRGPYKMSYLVRKDGRDRIHYYIHGRCEYKKVGALVEKYVFFKTVQEGERTKYIIEGTR